ncbi:MAG TPA: glycosyltransferase [Planctomycetaceae bacterium]|nr:glycosyltransferase [Planctomycetaceae bacterium]HIQ22403.1 glycosyltransferase [Planctomycetota bacterium]
MMTHEKLLETLIEVDRIDARLGEADHVIAMSQVLKEACVRVGVRPESIAVLGNRVSTSRFRAVPQANYDPRIIRALFVGRLQRQKNVHGVAGALASLKAEGWRVDFHICGGLGMNRYLEEALSVLDPADWRYWGPVCNRELPARYQSVDMYAGPSFFEGFQIPLIEALACGKPCVASNQPPATEIIGPGTGELVDPEDPEDIARGIRRLKERLNDPQTREAVAEACRRQAVERWSYRTVSAREVDVYLEVLAAFRAKEARKP